VAGGAIVARLRLWGCCPEQAPASARVVGMNAGSCDGAWEARDALERAGAPRAALRRTADQLATMRAEIVRQGAPGLSDEAFCASDVAFHRALVDGAGNKVLSYQLAGAVEAMQPLMNMITFTARSREAIVALHTEIADALEAGDAPRLDTALIKLEAYTRELADTVANTRTRSKREQPPPARSR